MVQAEYKAYNFLLNSNKILNAKKEKADETTVVVCGILQGVQI